MANGTRYNATTNQLIDLYFLSTLNGQPWDIEAAGGDFEKVEIYASEADALAETNKIETITTIVKQDTGLYKYTVAALTNPGTYYDKVFIIPRSGATEFKAINFFTVIDEDFNGGPANTPKVSNIHGFLTGFPVDVGSQTIRVSLNKSCDYKDTVNEVFSSILKRTKTVKSNSINGYWEVTLITTDYLPIDAYYIFQIGDLVYNKKVPNHPTQDFFSLPDYVA